MNILNIIRNICLMGLLMNQGISAYEGGWEGSIDFPDRAIIDRIKHPNKQSCLDEIDNALELGACGTEPIDLSCLGLGSLTPMEIALKRADCGLLGVLLKHPWTLPITGDQIIECCIQTKHGINIPLLIKLVAATASSPEQAAQIRNELRNNHLVIARQ